MPVKSLHLVRVNNFQHIYWVSWVIWHQLKFDQKLPREKASIPLPTWAARTQSSTTLCPKFLVLIHKSFQLESHLASTGALRSSSNTAVHLDGGYGNCMAANLAINADVGKQQTYARSRWRTCHFVTTWFSFMVTWDHLMTQASAPLSPRPSV